MDIIDNFTKITGAKRMVQNLVFSSIRDFNSNPSLSQTHNPLFGKLIVSGGKALDLFVADPINTFQIDTNLLLSNESIDKLFVPKNTPIINEIIIINAINNWFRSNSPEQQLQEIANNLTKQFNQKVDFSSMTDPYSNMIYVIQLDAIMQLINPNVCKNTFVANKPCYSCKVVHKIEKSIVEGRNIWSMKFKFQIGMALSYLGPILEINKKEINFFEIRVPDGFLQFQNYLGRLSVEISPQLPVLLPTHILNFTMDLRMITDQKKRTDLEEKLRDFIKLPLTKYSCNVVDLLYPKFDEIAFQTQYQLMKSNPSALNSLERRTFEQLFKSNKLSGIEMKDYLEKMAKSVNPLILRDYERKFIEDKLKRIGIITDLTKRVIRNSSKNQNINMTKLPDARALCEKYFGTKITVADFSKNQSSGLVSKYNEMRLDNYYSKNVYDSFRTPGLLNLLILQQNNKRYDKPIVKFTSFGFIRFFMENYQQFTQIPNVMDIDDLDEGATYFLSMPFEEDYMVSRNSMDMNGFLLIIKPIGRNNIRSDQTLKIDFYNYKIKLERKIRSYQKIETTDGRVFIDPVQILLFTEI